MKERLARTLRARCTFLSLFLLCLQAHSWQGPSSKKGPPSKSAQPKSALLTIRASGRFSAQHGLFFAEERRIHLYSHLSMVLSSKGDREMAPDDDELLPRWKGEPYYHTVYELRAGEWVKVLREFSTAPELYFDFGPCDPLNQLDLYTRDDPPKALEKIRPRLKVKDVTLVGGKSSFATVVYSDAPNERVTYPLKVALTVPERGLHSGGWKLLESLDVGGYGHFCGTRMMETKLASGETVSVLLVYLNEPAGSSDYIAVYSFLITTRDDAKRP